jgi:hypothetical protein
VASVTEALAFVVTAVTVFLASPMAVHPGQVIPPAFTLKLAPKGVVLEPLIVELIVVEVPDDPPGKFCPWLHVITDISNRT